MKWLCTEQKIKSNARLLKQPIFRHGFLQIISMPIFSLLDELSIILSCNQVK